MRSCENAWLRVGETLRWIGCVAVFTACNGGSGGQDASTEADATAATATESGASTSAGTSAGSATASTTNGADSGSGSDTGTCEGADCPDDCELDESCVDPTPSSCGNGQCDPTDHCHTCSEDCSPCEGTPPTVDRGPYLQSGAPTSVIVKWRTTEPTDSAVAYGPAPDQLIWVQQDSEETTEHEVTLTGLTPSTRYYYAFGTTDAPLLGGDEQHRFVTSPSPGTPKATRIWLIGDSGEPGDDQRAVRDAYVAHAGESEADLWIMLGDNAYSDGTDTEYQEAVFSQDAYAGLLRNTMLWATIGNHERVSDNGDAAPYFTIFALPTQAEAGGVASGTEYYYSFDYGFVHFVCLDSDTHEDSEAAMTWLRNDLEANDKKWLIAFWHHPPYTNGSHNSDLEGSLADMRENYLPILEEFGVDLVFTGHSHSYERSVLLYGHYGAADELATNPDLVLAQTDDGDKADGDPMGDGAYAKQPADACPDIGIPLAPGASCGTVYSVVGSSAKVSSSDYPNRYDGGVLHPAMVTYKERLGSVVVDIDGDVADVVFLDSGEDGAGTADYTITDTYQLVK